MRKVILVVDDELEVQMAIASILEDEGYEVLISSDGKDALELLNKRKPDLILSDIMMPHMNGHQLLESVKNHKVLKTIPVVLMSAGIIKESNPKPDHFIKKPFNLDSLLETVEKYVGPST